MNEAEYVPHGPPNLLLMLAIVASQHITLANKYLQSSLYPSCWAIFKPRVIFNLYVEVVFVEFVMQYWTWETKFQSFSPILLAR